MTWINARSDGSYFSPSQISVLACLALTGLLSCPAVAQPIPGDIAVGGSEYDLNRGHSRISFSIGHFFVSSTQGQFTAFDGKLNFEPRAPERGFVIVHVHPASITTDSAARDQHLRGVDFFDVDKFPSIDFQSKGLAKLSSTTGKLTGALSLHGITRPITLNVTLLSPDLNGDKLDFSAAGTLKRSDYGMNNYMGVIGDEVSLDMEVEFDRNR